MAKESFSGLQKQKMHSFKSNMTYLADATLLAHFSHKAETRLIKDASDFGTEAFMLFCFHTESC